MPHPDRTKPARRYSRSHVTAETAAYVMARMELEALRTGSPVQQMAARLPEHQRPRTSPPTTPAATNRFRAGDVLTPSANANQSEIVAYTYNGIAGELVVTASYGEFIDYGFFPYGEMTAAETVKRVWVGNLTHITPIRK